MLLDNGCFLSKLILPGTRWRRPCQAALLACLSAGTLRGGGEQKAPLQPSCVQGCVQGAQLAVWHTAVTWHTAVIWHTAVCRLPQGSHGTVWHPALSGTHLSRGAQLCRAQLSQGTQLSRGTQLSVGCTAGSGYTAVCRTHSCLVAHSCLQLQNSCSIVLPEVDSP